ncbi:uncharacterized protein N7515_007716 [Penicillium bovifimosum]|uniref:Uncharacterized protein n=1 Tax=Penicillium bovifimosum TaxID=126998 RepID=A0A9W9GLM7_9EURO|nr:uncharacterized protein N7515_007716 [Penicillium bovifimosum]KAJ5123891.1 hypothetical protein N7515_007716 [Penicillium bovifimosum]
MTLLWLQADLESKTWDSSSQALRVKNQDAMSSPQLRSSPGRNMQGGMSPVGFSRTHSAWESNVRVGSGLVLRVRCFQFMIPLIEQPKILGKTQSGRIT